MTITKEQIRAALQVTATVAEAIRELGEVPSGHLYARLSSTGFSMEGYEQIIKTLVKAKLVERTPGHLLRWIGPKK